MNPADIARVRCIELDLLDEPVGVVGQQDLLARPDDDGDGWRELVLLLDLEDELFAEDVRTCRGQRVRRGELASELIDDRTEPLQRDTLAEAILAAIELP